MEHSKLEIQLLKYWKSSGIDWLYKRKHRVKAYRGERLVNFELFYDITSGLIFQDINDIANYDEDVYPKDIKVHIDTLIKNREKNKEND